MPYKSLTEEIIREGQAADVRNKALAEDLRVSLPGKIAAARVAIAQAKEQDKQRLVTAIADRQRAFLGTMPPGRAFVAPAEGKIGAIVFGPGDDYESSGNDLSLDVDRLGLSGGLAPQFVTLNEDAEAKAKLTSAFAKLKAAGASTVYIFYPYRSYSWEGPVAFRPRTENVLLQSRTVANQDYPQVQAELQQAKAEMDAAERAYNADLAQTRSKGTGNGLSALTSLPGSLATASRYNKAQNRFYQLRDQLGAMSAQTTNQTRATITTGDISYQLVLNAPLVIFACDTVTARCAERERPVNFDITIDRPLVVYPGEPSADARKQQLEAAQKKLRGYRSQMEFGFPASSLGDFFQGYSQTMPVSRLVDYLFKTDESERKAFEARQAGLIAKSEATFQQIGAIAPGLTGRYLYGDIVDQARARTQEAERRSKQRGLE